MGIVSKLLARRSIRSKWPSIERKIKFESITKNCEITGEFPRVGSTRLAIPKPVEFDKAAPATATAAVTACKHSPSPAPRITSKKIVLTNEIKSKLVGTISGSQISSVIAKANRIFNWRLKAVRENIGAAIRNADNLAKGIKMYPEAVIKLTMS